MESVFDRQGTLAAQEKLSGVYSIYRLVNQWEYPAYFLGLNSKTVHLYSGHSNVSGILNGEHKEFSNSDGTWHGNLVYFDEPNSPLESVLAQRISSVGSGFPPFSDTPALNLVFVEGCDTGKDISKAFVYMYLYYNGYLFYQENQSVLGCKVHLILDFYRLVSEHLFQKLAGGHTYFKSLSELVSFCDQNNINIVFNPGQQARKATLDDFRIFGDSATTIKNVYDPEEFDQSVSPFREIAYPDLV